MALGTPVVTTTLGVEGLEVCQGRETFIADSPKEFAQYVCILSGNPELRASMARRARRLIEQKYDWNLVVQPLERMIESFDKEKDSVRRRIRPRAMVDAA